MKLLIAKGDTRVSPFFYESYSGMRRLVGASFDSLILCLFSLHKPARSFEWCSR